MKLHRLLLLLIVAVGMTSAQDWANLNRYGAENDKTGLPERGENRVVFMGNSITDSWRNYQPEFFEDNLYINRGISGQTTPQMLIRFRPDVIDLKPAVVVILAGTNDIAGNTGPMTQDMILGNIISMCELARANGIKVVLASVLPAFEYRWKPDMQPAPKIAALNKALKRYAISTGIVYLDYYSPMVDDRQGLQERLTSDGVHPNAEGYKLMAGLVQKAIAKALELP